LVTFDFVSNQAAIDDGNISPTFPVLQTEFIDDDCIPRGVMPLQDLSMQILSNHRVVHCFGIFFHSLCFHLKGNNR
jgi:hypothetical protein